MTTAFLWVLGACGVSFFSVKNTRYAIIYVEGYNFAASEIFYISYYQWVPVHAKGSKFSAGLKTDQVRQVNAFFTVLETR